MSEYIYIYIYIKKKLKITLFKLNFQFVSRVVIGTEISNFGTNHKKSKLRPCQQKDRESGHGNNSPE
jgi:hypothetical protein